MYIVKNNNGDQIGEFEELKDALDLIRDNVYDNVPDLTEEFDNFLNDNYSEVEIYGYLYAPALALHRVDPAAYNESYNEYVDGEIEARLEDLKYEANRLNIGEFAEYSLTGYTITYTEEEEVELEL